MTRTGAEPRRQGSTVDSSSWGGARVVASVLVTTWNRAGLLPGLLDALERQRPPHGGFEVIVVDNGSDDDTFRVLERFARQTALPVRVVRLDRNAGPGPARNLAASSARGDWLLVTDDDCIPTPGWIESMLDALTAVGEPDVVQGWVQPVPGERSGAGPWDHTMWVMGPSPWFQTCNIGYRTSAFRAVGGFPENDPLVSDADRRAFGEDTLLGLAILATRSRRAFAPDAVVHHRVVPSTFLAQVRDRRNVVGMPGLARHAAVRRSLLHGVFLGPHTRRYDLALAGITIALATRRPAMVVIAVPWARARWRAARRQPGGAHRKLLALAGWFVIDGVVAVSLVEGSLRHRSIVL